jgi:hypothetical protein
MARRKRKPPEARHRTLPNFCNLLFAIFGFRILPINGIGTALRSGGGVGGDDAADSLRYLVATMTRAAVQRKLRAARLTIAL